MAKSIGIDLGTTNSVAGIKKVHTEIINNAEGDPITPSCVTIAKKKLKLARLLKGPQFVVGKNALEWIKQDPVNTITAIKRLMGRSFANPEVQKMIADRHQRYRITQRTHGTEKSLAVILDGKEYAPEQISAQILAKIRNDCEAALKDDVEYAVITVPAYFNDKQKHATRTAAALAGLKVRRLLPEPTAAAISFGVDTVKGDDAKTVLVFDYGGGTFDLSVLTISGGQFIEQGKGGNMWLGGEDIDRELIRFALAETAKENQIEDMAALIDRQEEAQKNRFLGELKIAVENAKIRLSEDEEAYVEVLGLLVDEDGDRIDVDVEVSREQFEKIIAPTIESLLQMSRQLLEDIHFTPDLIDNVLLVGGSSRIPAVIRALQAEFGQEKVMVHPRPMMAIAEGAAILSHRLADTYECPQCAVSVARTDTRCQHCGFDLERYIIDESVFDIVHAAAHDYYIRLENNQKYLLIEKNTPLPCEHTDVFTLVHPEQKLAHMRFINMVNDVEESIGDLWLGIDIEDTDAEAETENKSPSQIEITLKIDENNLIEVAASVKEHPEVKVSKTLSRGNADETLFLSLESLIDSANQKEYDNYIIVDMTARALSVIKDIDLVIDRETGNTVTPVFDRVKMKIETAEKLAEERITVLPSIYYARQMVDQYGGLMEKAERLLIESNIRQLEQKAENGTYEQVVKASDQLHSAVIKPGIANMMMTLQKAANVCEEHEPTRSTIFYNTIEALLGASSKADVARCMNSMEKVLPEAIEVIKKYDRKTGKIYKDIKH